MTNSIVNIFCVVLVLSSLAEGAYPQCKLGDIEIIQTLTGKKISIADEYLVTVTNNCRCTQRNVILDCTGFTTLENIDPFHSYLERPTRVRVVTKSTVSKPSNSSVQVCICFSKTHSSKKGAISVLKLNKNNCSLTPF